MEKCQTEELRKNYVSQHHVCWSEIYNLDYFNPVCHCVVDPMHCLFLGVAKWIIMKLWIGESILNDTKLKIMQKRVDTIKILSNLGCCPTRIATDRKSTRLNSSHLVISYAVFCLKKQKNGDKNGALHVPGARDRAARVGCCQRAAVSGLTNTVDARPATFARRIDVDARSPTQQLQ